MIDGYCQFCHCSPDPRTPNCVSEVLALDCVWMPEADKARIRTKITSRSRRNGRCVSDKEYWEDGEPNPNIVVMPRELSDDLVDAALRATAAFLDIKGSALTVNREKMRARYRALIAAVEAAGNKP